MTEQPQTDEWFDQDGAKTTGIEELADAICRTAGKSPIMFGSDPQQLLQVLVIAVKGKLERLGIRFDSCDLPVKRFALKDALRHRGRTVTDIGVWSMFSNLSAKTRKALGVYVPDALKYAANEHFAEMDRMHAPAHDSDDPARPVATAPPPIKQ